MVDRSIVFCMLTRPGNFQWLTHQSSTQSSGFASRISTWCWRICTPPVKSSCCYPAPNSWVFVGVHATEMNVFLAIMNHPHFNVEIGDGSIIKRNIETKCYIKKWRSSSLGKKNQSPKLLATSKSSPIFSTEMWCLKSHKKLTVKSRNVIVICFFNVSSIDFWIRFVVRSSIFNRSTHFFTVKFTMFNVKILVFMVKSCKISIFHGKIAIFRRELPIFRRKVPARSAASAAFRVEKWTKPWLRSSCGRRTHIEFRKYMFISG